VILRSLARGCLAGAAVGGTLTLVEVCCGYLCGSRYPIGWWGFLALYYVPALGAAGGLLGFLSWTKAFGRRLSFGVPGVVEVLCFAYPLVVANHEYLGALPFLHAERGASILAAGVLCGAARWPFAGVLGRRVFPALDVAVFHLLRLVLLVAACHAAVLGPRPGDPVVNVLLFLFAVHASTGLACALVAGTFLPRPMRFRALLLGVALAAAGLCLRGLTAEPAGFLRTEAGRAPTPDGGGKGRPNVVLVVLDTVGAADLSCYGNPRPTSPNLDAFARRATLYERCLAPAPWSLPSHASLFTGLFPSQHRADFELSGPPCRPRALDPRLETLASHAARRGYATAAFVANDVTFDPIFGLDRGFAHLDARSYASAVVLRVEPLLRRIEGRLPYWAASDVRIRWFGRAWRSADEIVDAALGWLKDRRPTDSPYFLFLNFMDAHTPYAPPAGAREVGVDRSEALPLSGRPSARSRQPLTATESRHVRALHEAAVSRLDAGLGRLLAFLEAQPDWSSTWVVVTSDHGESLSEGRTFGHSCETLSQEVLHVPLIVRDPRADEAGRRDGRPVQLVDVAPALLEAIASAPSGGAGGLVESARSPLLALAACNCPPGVETGLSEAIIEDEYKYVRIGERPARLYDLAQDPREAIDLAAQQPERLERLRAALARAKQSLPPMLEACASCGAEGGEQALRTLGYVR
jgi:arylsulfatase A-like enzyme